MQKESLPEMEPYIKRQTTRHTWQKVVGVLACIVVFVTTYALILPAVTMESQTFCGMEAHSHDESCYSDAVASFACTYETLNVHVHTDACYGEDGSLSCTVADYVLHTHDSGCYDAEGNLLCQLPEVERHVHDESCYTEVEKEVVTEHTHTDACYTVTSGALLCELAETEGHTHTEACYTDGELSCGQDETEAHTHTETCYAQEKTLICQQEEGTTTQTVTESVLTCTADQLTVQEHVHSDACSRNSVKTCTLEEHTHTLSCYSDPTADVESAADWEKTIAGAELTGVWADDVLAIARTQLGYQESTKNYTVLADGETTKGYTRYGAWYGDPYGDWCAMFVSFCLDYAGVENFPLDSACPSWVQTLSGEEYGLYAPAEEYAPRAGDLIFFDNDGDGSADHVGLVESLEDATEDTPAQVTAIEGNSANKVQTVTYAQDSENILGYATLPAQLTAAELDEVEAVIAMIDAMPSADEIDAKLAAYEEAEDYEGMEAWYTEVVAQVCANYEYYTYLTDAQKALVTNADKLLELEYIWSVALNAISTNDIVSDSPTTVKAASTSEFIDLNLYDYGSNINNLYNSNLVSYTYTSDGTTYTKTTSKYPGFQWNGGAYAKSKLLVTNLYVDGEYRNTVDRNVIDSIDFGNSLITDISYGSSSSGSNGKSSNATDITINKTRYYNINSMDVEESTYGITNRPIGLSLASSITNTSMDVLKRTLGSDGYPALKDGTSLSYLFTQNTYATKKNTTSIDGLFQQDATSGEYYYNSRWNHAQYSNNKFTLYNQIITPNFITYPFGNFLPFNSITNSKTSTQVSKITSMSDYVQGTINDLLNASDYNTNAAKSQLVDMLAMYRTNVKYYGINNKTWSTFTAKDAIIDYFCGDQSGDNPSDDTSLITNSLLSKLYNIDWDEKTNFFFGMDMSMDFIQPKGGMTGNDTNKDGKSDYPMVFYFTGDDDVWVYIDGVLFLDLSGIHRHVGGEIDFVNGVVNYYNLDTENGGDVATTPYKTYTFAEILSAAGKSTDGLNSNGTFKDYTTHHFKFYYMERGSGSSVCRLNFNFPLLRQNSISVSKEVSSDVEIQGNPDYMFQVLKADSNGNKTGELFIAAGTEYTIYDSNDEQIGTGTTDENGVLTLKAGQRAEFVGIKENAGKYYVRELLEGTVLEQYGKVTVSGESTTKSNNVTVGSDTFTGMDSPVKDMSDGATAFRFTNDVDESKLGQLNISKVLTEYGRTREVKYFDIEVTLDGEKLPVGTSYLVGTETRKVEIAGIITIAADETATISNILAGTAFTVKETSGSAEGYTVTYNDSGGYTITVNEGTVSGIIKTSANVQLVVTNAEKGATVTIPGTKALANPDGEAHTYTFRLDEVTDQTGATLKEGGISGYEAMATLTEETVSFSFSISYVQVEQTVLPTTYYYRITETAAEDSLENETVYVAEVTVASDGSGGITATVTGMWKDGVKIETLSADFTNTLASSLSLEKTVSGGAEAVNQAFTFTVKLEGENLPDAYPAVFYQQDGSMVETTVTRNAEGDIVLTGFKHGEKAVISGIPYGATWTITESDNDGYQVTAGVTVGETLTEGTGSVTSGSITMDDTQVVYTNAAIYELPETGGPGLTLYTMAGIVLIFSASGLMYIVSKRRKGGNFS